MYIDKNLIFPFYISLWVRSPLSKEAKVTRKHTILFLIFRKSKQATALGKPGQFEKVAALLTSCLFPHPLPTDPPKELS